MHSLRRIPLWAAVVLLVYMPFHIFLTQSLSLVTGGLEVWKVGKDVFLALAVLFTICLVWQQKAGNKLFNTLMALSVIYFVLHMLVWLINPDIYQKSALIGTIYNTRLPGFLLLGYGAALLYPGKFVFSSILKIVLAVSTVVAVLGIVQYFLPKDVLTHLGYGLDRGTRAAFFIDDNPVYPRIMSTLREPNALGAYLILPFSLLSWLVLYGRNNRRRILLGCVWMLHALAIFLTYSRSAWLGAAVAVVLVAWWGLRRHIPGAVRKYWPLAVGIVAAIGIGLFLVRGSTFFQQYVVHSNPQEQVVDLDSNDYHTLLIRQGLEGIVDKPLGHGPGTAGLASIQNPKGGQLTENYYIQLGYEVGVIGLALFVMLNAWVYLRLWKRGDYIAVTLCASFWAYVCTNMLLHSWSNEAVAAQWWLLAGLALWGSTARAAPDTNI